MEDKLILLKKAPKFKTFEVHIEVSSTQGSWELVVKFSEN